MIGGHGKRTPAQKRPTAKTKGKAIANFLEAGKRTQWQKGQSPVGARVGKAGRVGRPLGTIGLTKLAKGMLDRDASCIPYIKEVAEAAGLDPSKVTVAEAITANWCCRAGGHDSRFLDILLDRIEGKVVQKMEIHGQSLAQLMAKVDTGEIGGDDDSVD